MKSYESLGHSLVIKNYFFAPICLTILIIAASLSGFSQSAQISLRDIIETIETKDGPDDGGQGYIEAEISISDNPGFSNLITAMTYSFAPGNAMLTDMSTGTTQLVGPGLDDTASAVTNIGFDFWYDGVRFTQFSVNPNGLARLGGTAITTAFDNGSTTTGFATTTNAPKIAPYFEDLCVGTNGKVHFKIEGTAPNRKLIVEWQNMQVTRGTGCAGAGAGTFQMWLFESASAANPGVIQFVYGNGIVASQAADAGASIGLQSGVATNFASVTSASDSVSYAAHDPLNALGIVSSKSYIFTPNVPTAPSGGGATPTQTSIQLNWADNAMNEVGYAIYRSTDNINFTFLTQTAVDAVMFNDTGLNPGSQYFYQVQAVTEGVLSPILALSSTTLPAGEDTCAGAGGDWDNIATWTDGSIPTNADNVTIGTGCTVTVNVANAVALNVAIGNGGTLQSPLSGAVTNNNLTVGGSVTNNGTFDFSTNGDTSAAVLTFGASSLNVSFSGTGATTDVRGITVDKGAQARVVELSTSNFTVQGVNTDVAGFLTLTSGTFKISGAFTLTNRIFTAAAYSIPAAGGIWLNNPNFTVAGQNGSPTVTGLFRLTQGTYNVGTSSGNSMGGGIGAQYVIEGGTLNTAGRLQTTSVVSYSQSGGTVNVCTVGNTATTACFGLTATTNTFNLTGGTIALVLPNTNATPLDYSVSTTSIFLANPAGTTLQIGNGSTPAASTFRVTGNTPNLLVSSGQNMNVGSGTAGAAIFFRGSTVVNNGSIAIQGTGASSRFDFAASGPMAYGGSGTFGTAGTPFAGVGISANSPTSDATTVNSPIFVNRTNFFNGGFVNSNQITYGSGGTSTVVMQFGNSTTPTNAGNFDVAPNFNIGTGGQILLYLRPTMSRTTGVEINPTRILSSLTHDNNDITHNLTIAGGDLTISGAMTLTNGVVITGANNLIHNGAATRTNGFVNGNLRRSFGAAGAYTYHVGTANGYSPVAVTTTAGTFPADFTVKAVQGPQPNIFTPSLALSRFWSLTGTGVTADLVFSYLDPADIPGTATEGNFVIQKYDGTFTQPGGTVNTAANTATITGVTSFSDWTLAEPGALLDTTPPDTTINSNPTDPSGSTSATFTFSGTDPMPGSGVASFECDLDAGGFGACTSPRMYTGLAEGMHTFMVRAIDGSGNVDPTPASFTWTISSTPAGPVSVVATAGTPGPTDYLTLKDAIDAINAGTHQGAITVSIVSSTTETATSVLNSSGAGSASYSSVLVRPVTDGVTVSGPSLQGRGLIELNGADNVTIDGDNPNTSGTNRDLSIQNTAVNTTTFTSVVRIALATSVVNSADNNVIKNVNVIGSATGRNISTATTTTSSENTTFGIFAGPGGSTVSGTNPPAAVTSVLTSVGAGATATNLMVDNNSIKTVGRGISINGSATTVFPGIQITQNRIGNQTAGDPDQVYSIGITGQGSANGLISGNTVWVEGFIASSAATHGINVGVNSVNATFTIERNMVNRVRNSNPATWSAFGINLGGGSNHVVQNNFVSGVINSQVAGTGGFGTTFGAYGIRISSGTGHKIYHNSVHLYDALAGTVSTDLTAAFLMSATTQTGVDVRNNIFSNQIAGGNPTGTRNVAIYLPSAATVAMNLTLNNNAYYNGADALNRMAQVGATFGAGEYLAANFDPTATTPATNFRAYSSILSAAGTNDNASFASTSPPPFTSNVNLHIPNGTATRLESGGAMVGVTTDIDLEMRNATTPDIGADEFAGLPPFANDMAATVFVTPVNGATVPVGQTFTPQATFTNNGTATQTNVTVRYRIIDAMMNVIYNETGNISTIAPLQNAIVSFPSTSILSAGTYTIRASSELAGDQDVSNDTINGMVTAVPPITGTVNVGSGETYTSLTNAGGFFQAVNTSGISGSVTVNITSNLTGETGAVPLNQIAGQFAESAASVSTITIKPSGAPRTISGTSAASSGLIILHGADHVTFDGSLSGGTDRSLTITNNQATTGVVIWMRSPSIGNGATNNTIKNCILNGAPGPNSTTVAGVLTGSSAILGNAAEAANSNNTIQNNWIYRVQNSMYLRGGAVAADFDQNWVVSGNELGSTVANDKNIFRGMLIGNAQNFTVTGNTIRGIQSTGTTTAAMSGIQIAFLVDTGLVARNVISDIKNVSTTGTGAFGMQIGSSSTASNVTIANNFIYDIATTGIAAVNSNGHGLMFNGSGTGYNVYFNSVNMNTNQGTPTTSSAMNVNSTFATAGALNVRNNVFSNTQTTGTRYAVYSTAAASVFAAINYNDYFAQNVGFIGGSARMTLGDWQTATGQDANSQAVDPLFVSATDLHLQPTSPMVNTGVNGTGITTDIDGDVRDATPDIGADEIFVAPAPGSLQFSSATYSGPENVSPATVTVTRTGGSAGSVTVDYATSNGTATGGAACTAGIDYINNSGTLTFADGVLSQTFDVVICNDSMNEPNETINYALTNPTGGATIGMPNMAVQTIIDDDPPPGGFSVNDVRIFEGNSGTVNAVFTVTYTGAGVGSVQYVTGNGTAISANDYVAQAGTLNFNVPPFGTGPVTQNVSVVINGDTNKEANETFFLNLFNPSGGTISDGQGVGIIIDEDRPYISDFDNDKKSDYSIYRPDTGVWYIFESTTLLPKVTAFGAVGDTAVPGDYDGDGRADLGVFRPASATWFVLRSSDATISMTSFGQTGDKPVQGDFDSDGRTDRATFRPSDGTWRILLSSNGLTNTVPFGISTDRPVQADYDGDARTDIAVYRDGIWYVLRSSNGTVGINAWGVSSDRPVTGDFDGDGSNDLAIYRNGEWWIVSSLTGNFYVVNWGVSTDIPAPADIDGDGTTDIVIFRPSEGNWYVLRSSTNSITGIKWGIAGDVPVPTAYNIYP